MGSICAESFWFWDRLMILLIHWLISINIHFVLFHFKDVPLSFKRLKRNTVDSLIFIFNKSFIILQLLESKSWASESRFTCFVLAGVDSRVISKTSNLIRSVAVYIPCAECSWNGPEYSRKVFFLFQAFSLWLHLSR